MGIETAKGYVGKQVRFNIDNVPEEIRDRLINEGLKDGETYEVLGEKYQPATISRSDAKDLADLLNTHNLSIFTVRIGDEEKTYASLFFEHVGESA